MHTVNREGVWLKMRADERADLDIVSHVAADQRREGIRSLRASRNIRVELTAGETCRDLLEECSG